MLTPDTETKKILLIKNSFNGLLGRRHKEQLIVYSLISRLVLLFQKPIALLIYSKNEEKIVFKTLDTSEKSQFGDQELARCFDVYLKKKGISDNLESKFENYFKDSLFQFFGTKYHIVFFIINYANSELKPEEKTLDAKFEEIKINDEKYAPLLNKILEIDNTDELTESFNINAIFDDSGENLENWLDDEFEKFPWKNKNEYRKINEQSLTLKESDDIVYINNQLEKIRENLVRDIHKKIVKAPVVSRDGCSFNNLFVFIATATDIREEKESYYFPYTLRLMLCDEQRKNITSHYENILADSDKCVWYNEAEKQCCIQVNKENIGECLFRAEKEKSISIEDFLKHIEEPFLNERSFIDTPLASGILGISNIPDLSRSRITGEPFRIWKKHKMSARHACTICLTIQTLKVKKENARKITPKTLVTPVATNGVTSIAILFMSYEDETKNNYDNKEWTRSLHIYLNVVSRLMSTVRSKLKKLYLDEVSSIFKTHTVAAFDVNKSTIRLRDLVNSLNVEYDRIAHIYPFHLINFSLEINNVVPISNDIRTIYTQIDIYRYKIIFCLKNNDKFKNQLFLYKYVKENEIKEACNTGLYYAQQEIKFLYLRKGV